MTYLVTAVGVIMSRQLKDSRPPNEQLPHRDRVSLIDMLVTVLSSFSA